MAGERVSRAALGFGGLALFFAGWQAIGHFRLAGLTWPPLTDVLAMLADPDRRPLFQRALGATLGSTLAGYVWGTGVGFILAVFAHMIPRLRLGAERLAAVINSVPSIALGPIFLVLLSRESTPAAVSSIHVFFIVFVALNSGLRSASSAHHDVFAVLGARSTSRFLRLELPSALPALASGLRLAWPAALIGAIIGEWFGAPRGLGVLIVNAMQNFQIVLLWCAVFLAAVTSLAVYFALTAIERAVYGRFR